MRLRSRHIALTTATIALLALLAGCGASSGPRVDEPAVAERERPAPPPTVAEPPPRPAAPAPPTPQPSWPRLFLGEHDVPRNDIALNVDGLVATREELAHDTPHEAPFLNGPLSLREQLLLLAHLQRSDLESDPSFEAAARSALRRELAKLVLEHVAAEAAAVSDEEVRAVYEQRIEEFRQPPRVSVRLILVSTESEARTAMERLREGDDFSTVAQEISLHSSRATGGRILPFSRGTYSTELEDLAFSLRPGELGKVASSRGHFIVLKVADAEASVIPYEQVRPNLRAELEEERLERVRREFIEALDSGEPLIAGDGEPHPGMH